MTARTPRPRFAPSLLVPVLALLALACGDTTFDPFLDEARYFSVYGFLDADADTQFVRVMPLRDSIATPRGPIDAQVTLTDLPGGTVAVWQDSVFRFERGTEGHLFWSPQPPRPGQAYRFTVRRSDGAASSVTLTVPVRPPPPILTPRPAGARVLQDVAWAAVENVALLDLVYHVKDAEGDSTTAREVVVSYRDAHTRTPGGIAFTLDLSRDFDRVYNAFGFPPGTPPARVELQGLTLHVASASTAWSFVGSDLDFETLAIPDRFSNVEDGFGFLGALVRDAHPWTLPPEDVARLGFTDGQDAS
jgi:hypothetical protein